MKLLISLLLALALSQAALLGATGESERLTWGNARTALPQILCSVTSRIGVEWTFRAQPSTSRPIGQAGKARTRLAITFSGKRLFTLEGQGSWKLRRGDLPTLTGTLALGPPAIH